MQHGLSERRACRSMGVRRTSIRYQKQSEDELNRQLRTQLKTYAMKHRRYGTPRMTALAREQYPVNHKRIERLWREERLTVPKLRRKRHKALSLSMRPNPATRPNEVWCVDFIHDRTEYGEKLKMLTVLDEYTRECLEIRVEKRMRSYDVIETLDELVMERGKPRHVRSDNGAEFIAEALKDWLEGKGIEPTYIEPGSPWENGYVESFHGKFRDECLNQELFWSRGEAQVIADWYRESYNTERPHSALGYMTPVKKLAETSISAGQILG